MFEALEDKWSSKAARQEGVSVFFFFLLFNWPSPNSKSAFSPLVVEVNFFPTGNLFCKNKSL